MISQNKSKFQSFLLTPLMGLGALLAPKAMAKFPDQYKEVKCWEDKFMQGHLIFISHIVDGASYEQYQVFDSFSQFTSSSGFTESRWSNPYDDWYVAGWSVHNFEISLNFQSVAGDLGFEVGKIETRISGSRVWRPLYCKLFR